MKKLNRRDFFKFIGAASSSWALQRLFPDAVATGSLGEPPQKNILIFVFDTMSAKNLSLYGYPRKTTPNLERFAERATVYHSHYSAGNYTVPGTASLLTGTYPWTHRAINQGGLIARQYAGHNIFKQLGSGFHRLAFSQNVWANYFLNQFENDIEEHLDPSTFGDATFLKGDFFSKDHNSAYRALDDTMVTVIDSPTSLVFGTLNRLIFLRKLENAQGDDYPRGLPGMANFPLYYRLETVFDGVISECQQLRTPSLAYFHFFSPHEPYRPRAEFLNLFDDDFQPVEKPDHPLGYHDSQNGLNQLRRQYDQFIANVDFEFGRLLDALESFGLLENSYVVVTSDHGQLFERGVHGHTTPLLYESIINVPLMISSPGQTSRKDIFTPSSNVDILPTLLQKSGLEIPDWCEGKVLPEVDDQSDLQRSIFSLDGKLDSVFAPLSHLTVSIRKGMYKLIYYLGYKEFGYEDFEEAFELYNIENDPEELFDLAKEPPREFSDMKDELFARLADANRSY